MRDRKGKGRGECEMKPTGGSSVEIPIVPKRKRSGAFPQLLLALCLSHYCQYFILFPLSLFICLSLSFFFLSLQPLFSSGLVQTGVVIYLR